MDGIYPMTTILRDWSYRYQWFYDTVSALAAISVGGEKRFHQLFLRDLQINPDAKIVTDTLRIRPEKSEVFRLFGSNEKLKSYTDWEPKYSLEEGLEETINWFSESKNLVKYNS